MNERDWPIYAVLTKDGRLYYHDMAAGNRYGNGDGWLVVSEWGEARVAQAFQGDNRKVLSHDEVASLTLLTPKENLNG